MVTGVIVSKDGRRDVLFQGLRNRPLRDEHQNVICDPRVAADSMVEQDREYFLYAKFRCLGKDYWIPVNTDHPETMDELLKRASAAVKLTTTEIFLYRLKRQRPIQFITFHATSYEMRT